MSVAGVDWLALDEGRDIVEDLLKVSDRVTPMDVELEMDASVNTLELAVVVMRSAVVRNEFVLVVPLFTF